MKNKLEEEQKKLQLNFINYDLDKNWHSHWLINSLRNDVLNLVTKKLEESDILFDPQDLEHQVLFYLTTYSPGTITKKTIKDAIEQQYLIVRERLLKYASKSELDYLFRGLKVFYPDLNITYRLNLSHKNNSLYAVGDGRKFKVEFKKITDEKQISLFTGGLHYIHQKRIKGDTFAFYFEGDRYPWAIETTERSIYARNYKRDALLAHGINPDNAIELTRLYTLPGSPLNSISLIDKLVKRYYQGQGDIEALFTCTMPSYSKTKAATIAGGLNKVLCVKDAEHYFIPRKINKETCWENVTKRWIEEKEYEGEIKETHSDFKLLPVVDVFMTVKKTNLNPVSEIKNNKKVIYFKDKKINEKILIATSNLHKQKKLTEIVNGYYIAKIEKNLKPVKEKGVTFIEIARNKAIDYSKKYDCLAISTDGGAVIPALKSWESVKTRRFGKTEKERIEKLLFLMRGIKNRKVEWHEAMAMAEKGKLLFSAQAQAMDGEIAYSFNPEFYQEGIWLCSLTNFSQFKNKNFFELTDSERKKTEDSWKKLKNAFIKFQKNTTPV